MSKKIALVLLTLLIPSVIAQIQDIELANSSILYAEDIIQRMVSAGFSTVGINQTLIQAKNAFDSGMYGQTIQLVNTINSTANNAFRIYSQINEVQGLIDESSKKGYDVSDASDLLDIARSSFSREDYADAERFINKARLANQAAGPGRNIYLVIAEVFAILIVLSIIFYLLVLPVLYRKRLKALKKEEGVLKEKTKKIVQDYYESKITRDEFEKLTKISEYQLADVQEKIAYTESRLLKGKK